MFHLLSCFNLKPGIAIEDFQHALASYTEHMRTLDLLESTGPVGAANPTPSWSNYSANR